MVQIKQRNYGYRTSRDVLQEAGLLPVVDVDMSYLEAVWRHCHYLLDRPRFTLAVNETCHVASAMDPAPTSLCLLLRPLTCQAASTPVVVLVTDRRGMYGGGEKKTVQLA